MKKRLLFMLTVVMIMCAVMFSASAATCLIHNFERNPDKSTDPTCITAGTDFLECTKCGSTKTTSVPATGHTYAKTVVHATCEEGGCDKYVCKVSGCGSFYIANKVDPLGHNWGDIEYSPKDDHYVKEQTCKRIGCGKNEIEKENGIPVIYYKVEFFNGQALDEEAKYVEVESYGKKYKVPVDYTVLAKVPVEDKNTNTFSGTKVDLLQTNCFVKKGGSITYIGKKPSRTKDERYGEFRFVGWTKNKNYDLVPATVSVIGSTVNYNVTIEKVNANTQYYAAWEGVEVSYKTIVYNSDGQQLLVAQNIKHGDSIDYPFSYPSRESTTSSDYVFAGWEIGTKSSAGNYNVYCRHDTDKERVDENNRIITEKNVCNLCNGSGLCGGNGYAHIKDIPIYSGDAIKAVHTAIARKYKIEFCDKNWKVKSTSNVDYNSSVKNVGFDYLNYTDETGAYIYEYRGYWETEKGHKIYLENFTVPAGSIDYNDPVYFKDEDGNYFKNDKGEKLEVLKLHENLNANYFNSKVITYLFAVNEKGETIVNAGGKALTLLVYKDNKTDKMVVNELDANGNRVKFDEADARKIGTIKIRPVYYQKAIDYKFNIKALIPSDEVSPSLYRENLSVQITNAAGQLIAGGKTSKVSDDKNETVCTLIVPRSDIYNITIASSVKNEGCKYRVVKSVTWDDFQKMLVDARTASLTVELELSDEYKEKLDAKCNCICHNKILSGLWVRILNILYRLFGKKHVCCYDMFATIGNQLLYKSA